MAALTKKPSFQVAGDVDAARRQRAELDAQFKAKKIDAKTYNAQRTQVNDAITKFKSAPIVEQPTPQQDSYNNVVENANNAQNNLIGQINNQPQFTGQTSIPLQQFDPGKFQDTYNTARQSSLSEFERNNGQAFKQQQQDFDNYLTERGIDPNSEAATKMYKSRISDVQTNARLGAENQAQQAGLAAQNQAYGQNLSSYGQNLQAQGQQYGQGASTAMMPFQQLGAFNPYFNSQAQGYLQNSQNQFTAGQQQNQNQFANEQAKQQFEYQKYLQANQPRGGGGGGGGGGLSFEQQLQLQNNGYAQQMAMIGMQGQGNNPNYANNAIQGLAAGAGQGLVNGLTRG